METWVNIVDGGNGIHKDGGFRATLKDLQFFAEKHDCEISVFVYPRSDDIRNGNSTKKVRE